MKRQKERKQPYEILYSYTKLAGREQELRKLQNWPSIKALQKLMSTYSNIVARFITINHSASAQVHNQQLKSLSDPTEYILSELF